MTFDAATAICAACVAALGALWWVAPLLEPDNEPAAPAVDVIAEAKLRRTVDPDPTPPHCYWEHPNQPAPWHTTTTAPTWARQLACILAITARYAPTAHVVAAATGRVLDLPAPEALEAAG